MNMPNFASCHHAILCARVAASLLLKVEACPESPAPGTLIASALWPVYASAPAAPRCFRNDRLETSSVFISPYPLRVAHRSEFRLKSRRRTQLYTHFAGSRRCEKFSSGSTGRLALHTRNRPPSGLTRSNDHIHGLQKGNLG